MRIAALLAGAMMLGHAGTPSARPEWDVLDTWVAAVEQHTPGKNDRGVRALLEIRTTELESSFPHLTRVLSAAIRAKGREPRFDALLREHASRRIPLVDRERFEAIVRRIHAAGVDTFLKRAAALHADVAILQPDAHRSVRAGMGQLAADGRDAGDEPRPWHWSLGRAFLQLLPRPERDPEALIWYQAAAVHLLETRNLTEVNPHLARALAIFPDDPEIQFLIGFRHEAQGSADIQAAVAEMAGIAAGTSRVRGARVTWEAVIGSEGDENRRAKAAYARALEANPRHREARIHHARLLLLEGRHERAASELRAALDGLEHAALRYYAHLFLGQAEQSAGRPDAARAAFDAAVVLFPDAQSPRLGLAQLALQSGRREDARALFAFLATATGQDVDPWWLYFHERVPNRNEWLTRMWDAFAKAVT